MTHSLTKRCVVAYATPARAHLWTVELAPDATIADAISAARALAPLDPVPWEGSAVGIFGEPRARTDVPADGDRVEIYRELPHDPRQSRRERVRQARRVARRGG